MSGGASFARRSLADHADVRPVLTAPNEPSRTRSRLALAESMLDVDDPAIVAQRASEWIGHLGATQVLCAGIRPREPMRLVGLGGFGIPSAGVDGFSLRLDEGRHPLVTAFTRGRAVRLRDPDPMDAFLPIESRAVLAVPLFDGAHFPAGLLIAATPPLPARAGSRWLAPLLGPRLASCLAAEAAVETERRLQRENGQLTSIIDSVSDPILLTNPEGGLLIANEPAEALFVAADEESEGRRRAVALNNMLLSAALSRRAIAGREMRMELPLVDPSDGSDLLFELTTSIVRDGSAVAAILRNVTDLRHASKELEGSLIKLRVVEAEVRGERDRLNMVIDSVADPIVVTDASGNLVLTNPPAERFLAPPPRASRAVQRLVRANDAHFFSGVSNALFSGTEGRWRGEVNLADPITGKPTPFEAVAGKILSESGELTAIVTILHDRTEALEKARLYEALERASRDLERKVADATSELVRQNEVLRRQQVALEQASQLKSQFLANVSHEFRTPLNAILGYTSMLLAGIGGEVNETQAHQLRRVDSNARHLLATISDILDISKIEAGKMPIHVGRIVLDALVEEVMAELAPLIDRSNLKVRTRLARALPILTSDRAKVKQILFNLLSNALKFTPAGSVLISVRYSRPRDVVLLSVRDTGIGISAEHHARVFEDFRQVDSSLTRVFAGAGLGLSICRRFAEALGGRIQLRSKPGHGSTFTLELPRHRRRR